MYRGIQRPSTSHGVNFREVILTADDAVKQGAKQTVTTVGGQILHLIEQKIAPWPRTMPSHCFDYNRECVYLNDCDMEYIVPGNPEVRELSYTRIKEFMACPELYRRSILEKDDETDTEATVFGKAVHAGLAEVYKQCIKLGLNN